MKYLSGLLPIVGVDAAGCNIKWTPGSEPDYYGMQIVQK